MRPAVFSLLGKFGDIIICLPGFKAIRDRTGVNPVVIVSREFSSVLDGVSYVTADVSDAHWFLDNTKTEIYMREHYGGGQFLQFWNATKNDMMNAAAARGGITLRVHGMDWSIDQSKYPNFMVSMYVRMGLNVADMMGLPLVFDRRNPARELALRTRYFKSKKPTVLVNFSGTASPFAAVPEVLNPLLNRHDLTVLDIGAISAERIYDLLGLIDNAAGMITIDTSTLHLAHASKKPFIALTREGWSGSIPRGNCALNVKYGEAPDRISEINRVVDSWINPSKIVPSVTTTTKSMIRIRRTAALGDILAATVVADRLLDQGHSINFQCGENAHPILRRHPRIQCHSTPQNPVDVDLDGAYEAKTIQEKKSLSFAQLYVNAANQQLHARNIRIGHWNATPTLKASVSDITWAMENIGHYAKPWTMVCPKSLSWPNRTVPTHIWEQAGTQIKGTKFWLGFDPAPQGFVDLQCRHIDNLIRFLAVADLLVTTDTGPMHIAAALRTPIVAVLQSSSPENHLSDQNDFSMVSAAIDCLNCQQSTCHINAQSPPCQNVPPLRIANAVNRKLVGMFQNDISACVSIYRPEVSVLNRCLTALLDQVNEIIVCLDLAGAIPAGALQHGKIRYIRKNANDVGYGKKQNFAARHSNGAYILFINDDCFLDPGAVQKMRECMEHDHSVGMVSNLLRYPDGTLYHAGKTRGPGGRAWGHIDHGQREPTFKQVTELENACGCCVLVKRKAFYQIKGFDERIHLYGEDDMFAMAMRSYGYKILFTPFSTGIHLNHHSTGSTPAIEQHLKFGADLVEATWGWYFDKNPNNPLGVFK
jgi:ADP-heptose:LPS heptosyltransferase/GT2 family glycosyltransferase